VRDKDGISAALVMAELVAETRAGGRTLWDRLDDLANRFGVHLTAPVTLRFDGRGGDGLSRRRAVMERATACPPDELAGTPVAGVDDLSQGTDLPPTTGVVWELADRSRVVVRPSGTEPKLKAYLEVIEDVGRRPIEQATAEAAVRLDALRSAVARQLEG
jgi:phosphomannomutase